MVAVSVYLLATLDTKGAEAAFVRDRLIELGVQIEVLDTSCSGRAGDRGQAVNAAAAEAVKTVREAFAAGKVDGVIGLGGSAGTTIGTAAMRALPIGVPKLMVSTLASGNVQPWVGDKDILMLNSVVDIAGINRISRKILGEAAAAMAGMVRCRERPPWRSDEGTDKPVIAATMFGVTTPCVQHARKILEDAGYEVLVFHATGTGGQSMEKLVDSGMIMAVLDMTTTEVADYFVGGVFPAVPDRLGAIARTRVPYVGSCGALDMVNFGAVDSIPAEFADRLFHVHNPQVTLMRTTVAENRQFGTFIASKLNDCQGPVRFLLPEGGVSLLDAAGQPFFDPEADEALFATIESEVEQTGDRKVIRVPHPINHPKFVAAALSAFHEIAGRAS